MTLLPRLVPAALAALSLGLVTSLLAQPPLAGPASAESGAPSAANEALFDAGRLDVAVAPSGALNVTDAGRPVLRDGRVRITTALGGALVTGVRDVRRTGGSLVATLTTSDPLATVRLTLARGAQESLTLRTQVVGSLRPVLSIGLDWPMAPGERFYGTGERNDHVERRGTRVRNYVEDGPYRTEQLVVAPTVPLWGFGTRRDSTYFPIPWVLSSRGYGVLVRNDHTSTFDFNASGGSRWRTVVESDDARWQVFGGPRPADALRRFSAAVGRQPDVGAPWMFGPWVQTGQADYVEPREERGAILAMQRGRAPVSVAETHMRYLPCGADRGLGAKETARSAWMHRRGLAILTYINPLLCTEYREVFEPALADGAVQKTVGGVPFVYPAYVGGAQFTVRPLTQFDFTSPKIDQHYGRIVDRMVAHGHDGWMEDFGEYTPPVAVDERGRTGSELHNAYARDYHCQTQRMVADVDRPIVRFVRSGWTGSVRCSPVVWGGDPTSIWGFDGLRSVVTAGLSSGLSGIGVWGSDIGGFFALGTVSLGDELLDRWIQLGAFSGVMRAKNDGVEVPDKDRPLVWEEPHLTTWRRYGALRTQLAPYLLEAHRTYLRTGLPIMRHLVLTHPTSAASDQDDVFMFGPDMLVAPVLSPGATRRELALPGGTWVDLGSSTRYRDATRDLDLGAARLLRGSDARLRRVTVPAPRDQLPLLVRAGAVLAMLDPDVDTLTDFGRAGDVVSARERADRMQLLAFPRGRSVTRFGRGERLTSVEDGAGWRLEIAGRRARTYTAQVSLATLRRPIDVCGVRVDGKPLPPSAWRIENGGQVLDFRVRLTRGVVRVVSC
ncbi:TIM-barrel domain-containing protein [Nocardioides sp. R-C-SC26]|uniref:TIM-barrel domain-containing protein n=1 Tax=Nocardioides sp. R-C-SC26 TaxID=2870414 RepID=UPI001E388246|nr:TIM-barrel domain-containing protein [Nocardioides sp. R-C-SC26]